MQDKLQQIQERYAQLYALYELQFTNLINVMQDDQPPFLDTLDGMNMETNVINSLREIQEMAGKCEQTLEEIRELKRSYKDIQEELNE